MAVADIAHIFVFPAEPYQTVPVSRHGKVETKDKAKLDLHAEKPAFIEQTKACVEAPGTSITESVQDVVIGGVTQVVKDVALTISQAIEPVGKGVHLIQESIHHLSVGSNEEEDGAKVEVEEHVMEDVKADEAKSISLTQITAQNDDR
ncbi:hypothetical protein KSP39_PZI016176 [Platanthera zijinensis]|uniref:Uncharacterized protein n=1 Tax=Platanthera zijinensis TaxID=2320716 RepID=A0AAP0B6X1_9ASPA